MSDTQPKSSKAGSTEAGPSEANDRVGEELSDDARSVGELPKIRPLSVAMDVPVFNVVVYLMRTDEGLQARVANLPNLSVTGASEPMVLKQLVGEVKLRLAEWRQRGEPIPWLDPIPAPCADEQSRYIPVHL